MLKLNSTRIALTRNEGKEKRTSTNAKVFRLGDSVGFTPLAARTSSGVLV